jgi:hypothetical protein
MTYELTTNARSSTTMRHATITSPKHSIGWVICTNTYVFGDDLGKTCEQERGQGSGVYGEGQGAGEEDS